MFPLLSRFEFSVSALHRTACQFWIVHLPTSFLLTLLLAGSVWGCYFSKGPLVTHRAPLRQVGGHIFFRDQFHLQLPRFCGKRRRL